MKTKRNALIMYLSSAEATIINMIDTYQHCSFVTQCNSFKIDMLLGAGGSSKVFSCYDQWGGIYAVKILRKDKNFKDSVAQDMFIKEFQVMEMLKKHPNILNPYFINLEGMLEANGQREGIVYSIIELARKGNTQSYLNNCLISKCINTFVNRSGLLGERLAKFYFIQLLSAVSFLGVCNFILIILHQNSFAHMDIKLENILLDDHYNIKLADFGTTVELDNSEGLTKKRCGTRLYMAPEIKEGNYDEAFDAYKADIYSLGVTLYVMITGEFPSTNKFSFSDYTGTTGDMNKNNHQNFSKNNVEDDKSLSFVTEDCIDLLRKMMNIDPKNRITIDEILIHPWVESLFNCASPSEVYFEMNEREQFIVSKTSGDKPNEIFSDESFDLLFEACHA